VALLEKLIWRLGIGEISLCKEVVESKYRSWRNIRAQGSCRSDSLWWRDLKEVWRFEGWKVNLMTTLFGRSRTRERLVSGRIHTTRKS